VDVCSNLPLYGMWLKALMGRGGAAYIQNLGTTLAKGALPQRIGGLI